MSHGASLRELNEVTVPSGSTSHKIDMAYSKSRIVQPAPPSTCRQYNPIEIHPARMFHPRLGASALVVCKTIAFASLSTCLGSRQKEIT